MKIDIYADIACPWCWIGIRRMDRALARRPELPVERAWRPFQLNPGLPADGLPWEDFIQHKFGGLARAREIFGRLAKEGESESIAFDFEGITRANHTKDAHRLVLAAAGQGRSWDMAETLFRGYFREGRDLNSPQDLVELAVSAGMEAAEAELLIQGSRFSDAVRQSQERASVDGVSGVPFYVFNGRFGVPGAQPLDTFLHLIDRFAPGGDMAEPEST